MNFLFNPYISGVHSSFVTSDDDDTDDNDVEVKIITLDGEFTLDELLQVIELFKVKANIYAQLGSAAYAAANISAGEHPPKTDELARFMHELAKRLSAAEYETDPLTALSWHIESLVDDYLLDHEGYDRDET